MAPPCGEMPQVREAESAMVERSEADMKAQTFSAYFAVMLGIFAACGGEDEGEPTSTACPTNSTVSYEKDVAPFMTAYCTSCHATSVPVNQRQGAPRDHNFETEAGVLKEGEHVDEEAGADLTVTNTTMPPKGYPAPSVEERRKLSEWLACNAVGEDHDHDGEAGDHAHD
jgi:uncharacterized membrane protein